MGNRTLGRGKFALPILGLAFAALCLLGSSCGQSAKSYRVGIVSGVDTFVPIADGFKEKMTELGYVEGKNISYDLEKVNADPEGEKRIAQKFVQDKVDLIFAFPTDTAIAAKAATQGTAIPVVFAHGDAIKNKLVESIGRPGGNITGCRTDPAETTAKNFEYLHELMPNAKRVYAAYLPGIPNTEPTLNLLRPAASRLGVILVEEPVKTIPELKAALQKRESAAKIGIDAILIMPDPINYSPDGFAALLAFGKKNKVPVAGGSISMTDAGSLFSNFPDNKKIGVSAAGMADKIFKGTQAGTISVITPDDYLKLNCRAAQAYGLQVSEGLRNRADEVIQ